MSALSEETGRLTANGKIEPEQRQNQLNHKKGMIMQNPKSKEIIKEITSLASKGQPVSVDPDIADDMAAFEEEALDAEAAMESLFDEEDEDNG